VVGFHAASVHSIALAAKLRLNPHVTTSGWSFALVT
jgi:hypothetical protein